MDRSYCARCGQHDRTSYRSDEVPSPSATGMAIFFAIRDGLKDAREGKPPYFWGLPSPTRANGRRC